jgi:M6 family metalloprotease-like protein
MSGSAQQKPAGGKVQELNSQVLQAYGQFQSSPAAANGRRAEITALLEQRAAALESLIAQNPAEALRVAFSADVVTELAAAFPGARRSLESHGRWEGPIEYIIEDSTDFRSHRNIRAMSVRGETLYIQFAGPEPDGLQSGDVLRVEGVRAGNQVAADSAFSKVVQGAKPTPPPPSLTCSTLGDQPTIVLMVTMPGAALPVDNPATLDFDEGVSRLRIQDMFFNNGDDPAPAGTNEISMSYDPNVSLTDFWQENSYGVTKTSPNSQVALGPIGDGWFELDRVYSDSETNLIRAAAIAAADSVVRFTDYTRLFIVINGMAQESTWGGLGTIGCYTLSSGDGNFIASTSWIRQGFFVNENNHRGAFVAAHEGGHNLGLRHSNSREFGAEVLGTPVAPVAPGEEEEYDDSFSAMGRGLGHYAAPHKSRLGWLPGMVQTITTSQPGITVSPTESNGITKALKIRRGTDDANWFWLEYRQPFSKYNGALSAPFRTGLGVNAIQYLDAAISGIYTGGLIHYQDSTTGAASHLLDFTPQSLTVEVSPEPQAPIDWLDPVLVPRMAPALPWVDIYTGTSIATPECIASDPTVTISPANPSAKRRQTITYTVTVRNNDTSVCGPKTFNLTSTMPVGWTSVFTPATLTVPASSVASVSLKKTIPATEAFGTYSVDATATSGIYSGSATASATVKP